MLDICTRAVHRHRMTCARCGATDDTVAQTIVRDGKPWPPMCAQCATTVRVKSARLAARERVEVAG